MINLHPEGIAPIVSLLLLLLYLQTRPGISCATQLRSIPFFFFQMFLSPVIDKYKTTIHTIAGLYSKINGKTNEVADSKCFSSKDTIETIKNTVAMSTV